MEIKILARVIVVFFALMLSACDKAEISEDTGNVTPPVVTPPVVTPPVVTPPEVVEANIQGVRITGPTKVKEKTSVIVNAEYTLNAILDKNASFTWIQTSGATVDGFTTNNAELSFIAPQVTKDTELTFTVDVVGENGDTLTKVWAVIVKPASIAFINIGVAKEVAHHKNTPNQPSKTLLAQVIKEVNTGDTVSLSAQAQILGGRTATYAWKQLSGKTVSLQTDTSKTTGFVAPNTVGVLYFKVTATDPLNGNTTSQVQVVNVKAPPFIVQKGAEHIVYNGHGGVKLHTRITGGTPTYTYSWKQTLGPSASLSSNSVKSPTVSLPQVTANTRFQWTVTVTDANKQKATSIHTIDVQAKPKLLVSINGASGPIRVTEGDVIHPTASISGGSGNYTLHWFTTASTTIKNPKTQTPSFTAPDVTNTLGHDELMTLSLEVSDGAVDNQGKLIVVRVGAQFNVMPAFIANLHQHQIGSSGATASSVSTHHPIKVASQKMLHPAVDMIENAIASGTFSHQWKIIEPNPIPSGLSIAGDDQLHPILVMPHVTKETPLVLELTTTYTAPVSGKKYKKTQTLRYLIEPPAAPARQALSLSIGGHVSILSGRKVHPSVTVLNASSGGNLTYQWAKVSGPAITLNGAMTNAPSFTAPVVTGHQDIVLKVTVTDGSNVQSAQETFTISPLNIPPRLPIAVTADQDKTVVENSNVIAHATVLHGFGAFSYAWKQTSGPTITLNNANSATPDFVVPKQAGKQVELEVEVTRTDDHITATDTIIYSILGAIEVTAGNSSRDVAEGSTVSLIASVQHASGSVKYQWSVVDANGLTVNIVDSDKAHASILAPAVTQDTVIKVQVMAGDDVNQAKAILNITIKNLNLNVNAGQGHDVQPGQSESLHATISGGLPPYTYAWAAVNSGPALVGGTTANPSLTTPSPAQSTSIQYEVTVTDSINNTATSSVALQVLVPVPTTPPLPNPIDLSHNPALSNLPGAQQHFSLHTPVITGGKHPLTYAWSLGTNPHSITLTKQNTDNPTITFPYIPNTCNAIEGDITLTVTDSAGAHSTGTIHYKSNPAPQAMKPIQCWLCNGPKFICERRKVKVTCSKPEHQYCVNMIENLNDGSRFLTRKCATADEVNHEWYEDGTGVPGGSGQYGRSGLIGSANNNLCVNYDTDNLITDHVMCPIPCKGDGCNESTVPEHALGMDTIESSPGVWRGDGAQSVGDLEPPTPVIGTCP